MSTPIIRAALETRLANWAAAQVPAIPVSYQNVSFTKPTSGLFLECILIPNVTLDREVTGAKHTRYGLFQVNCWGPQGTGMRAAEALAESVATLYPVFPKVGVVSVEQTPHVGAALDGGSGWELVPVLVKYRYET